MMKNFIFYSLLLSLLFFMPFSKKTQAQTTEEPQSNWITCLNYINDDGSNYCIEINLNQVEKRAYSQSGEEADIAIIETRSSLIKCPLKELQEGKKCLPLKIKKEETGEEIKKDIGI